MSKRATAKRTERLTEASHKNLQQVRATNPIAILCSDIHLSHVAPTARDSEPSWYDAMERGLNELRYVQNRLNVPIICAGDIFDKWNSPPELINFAIRYLPKMYAIPGQHDLPNHNYDDIKRSAYWTLVEAHTIINLDPNEQEVIEWPSKLRLVLEAFPWGSSPISTEYISSDSDTYLAVCHRYIWTGPTNGHEKAAADQKLKCLTEELSTYDAAVFGDNHAGFITKAGKCHVMNCGTFFRRRSSDIGYYPQIGLLYPGGRIIRYDLDCEADIIRASDEAASHSEQSGIEMLELIRELREGSGDSIDFIANVRAWLERTKAGQQVKEIIQGILGL